MVSNIHILEHWFSIAGPPNTNYTKDTHSIPITLSTQLDNNRTIFTQWKHHRNISNENIKPYIINTFRILHPYPLADFFTLLKYDRTFELGFLREHNDSDPTAYHPIYYSLCSP